MRRDGSTCDPADVRIALCEAVVERLGLDPTRPRDADALARSARRAGVTAESVNRLRSVLGALESAAYGAGTRRQVDAAAAVDAYRAVDREAMMRYSRPSRTHTAAVALLAAALWLMPGDVAVARQRLDAGGSPASVQARESFTRGVDAYEMGQFALALRSFTEAAQLEPRAPDAWANAGTAAWVSGDTARAVQGWQRALRLEPTASDMRERLMVTPAGHVGPSMAVPPVPADVVLMAGALLWLAGWSFVAYRGVKRERVSSAFPVLGLALIALAAVEPLDRWIAAPSLTVVAGDAVPRVRPMLAADGGIRLRTGELARVTEREGVWIHVSTSSGRSGWIPADVVYPVARD